MIKSTNIFIDQIVRNSGSKNFFKKYIIHPIRIKKFKKSIRNGSPSFGLLWAIADFITMAEIIFFYDNSIKNNGLYSSKNYASGQNGFRVNSPECKITVKLYNESHKVMVEAERTKGDGIKTTLSFANDQWENDPTIYDEMLLEQIIRIINTETLVLFERCYNMAL